MTVEATPFNGEIKDGVSGMSLMLVLLQTGMEDRKACSTLMLLIRHDGENHVATDHEIKIPTSGRTRKLCFKVLFWLGVWLEVTR